jgi:hypothetical protein
VTGNISRNIFNKNRASPKSGVAVSPVEFKWIDDKNNIFEQMSKKSEKWRELLLLVVSLPVGCLGKGDPLNINVDIEDINIDKISADVSFLSLPIASNTLATCESLTCTLFCGFVPVSIHNTHSHVIQKFSNS